MTPEEVAQKMADEAIEAFKKKGLTPRRGGLNIAIRNGVFSPCADDGVCGLAALLVGKAADLKDNEKRMYFESVAVVTGEPVMLRALKKHFPVEIRHVLAFANGFDGRDDLYEGRSDPFFDAGKRVYSTFKKEGK